MTDKLKAIIGSNADGPVEIDLEALLGGHACIISNSGGGKSSLIRKINEVTHGHVQQILLDPEDDFYTLREKFDYVIAGGEDGDVPATLANARDLALATLTHGFNLIVQLNDLGADAPTFVARFLEGLMSAGRELWHPVLITIDELQRFASRDAGESIPAIKDLVFRGRKRGFTALFASLRMAEIDPGIRGMVNNWMLGRNGQALDRRTMAEQLGFTAKEGRERLAHIVQRHFWGMGPALSVEPMMFKVGDVETTPLRTGQTRIATPPPPEALRGILAGLKVEASDAGPEKAEERADSGPSFETGRVIDSLREQVRDAEHRVDFWKRRAEARGAIINNIRDILPVEPIILEDGAEDLVEVTISHYPPVAMPRFNSSADFFQQKDKVEASIEQALVKPEPKRSTAIPEGIEPRWLKILDAIAWSEALLKMDAVDRAIIGWAAGKSPNGGGFQNDMGAMRTRGLITYPREGTAALTEEGRALANLPVMPPPRGQLDKMVKAALDLNRQSIFDALKLFVSKAELYDFIKHHLEPRLQLILDSVKDHVRANRVTIAEHIGKSAAGGGFQNDLGRLRTLGLIDYPEPGYVELGRIFS